MTGDAIDAAKAALRRTARTRRAALDEPARAAASAAVRDRLLGEQARLNLAAGPMVAGYWPIRDELDPRPALRALREGGARIALPAVVGETAPLVFREWREGDRLAGDGRGLQAPLPTAPSLDPDLILVPLLAFDGRGTRLGYGAGYYDRTLAVLRARRAVIALGLAYEVQELPEIPSGPLDAPLDGVVTEQRVLWLRAA
jgi:5-formyltetrahydrofolate cyclo-ligase